MRNNNTALPESYLGTDILANIGKTELVDMLQHKTQLLMTFTVSRMVDKDYLQQLKTEVENIQAEIRKRLD